MQDILNDKDCEELDPDSGSIHTGNPIMFPETTGTGKKSQPPTSLNLNPVIGPGMYYVTHTVSLSVSEQWHY